MLDHLEGEAQDEIRYRFKPDREDPENTVTILKDIVSWKQLEGESLQEFSQALLSIMEKIKQTVPNGISDANFLLRDQFVEKDPFLCREQNRCTGNNPPSSLLVANLL